MVPPPPIASQSRPGTFSPARAAGSHSGTATGPLSSASSPTTGSSSLTKIVIAQVYLLLSTIKEDKGSKWELQVEQLRKLVNDHGMSVYSKYFARLVATTASQIFPGFGRSAQNPANYHLLTQEMENISHDINRASNIAESIETASEDVFRDFDLSTFMEHFKLDALEKTILALAFKFGSRPDLKAKADAILSTNFPTFVNILSRPDYAQHADLDATFIALIVDRYIQGHPPNFNSAAKSELVHKVKSRWPPPDNAPPMPVLAALDLTRVLADKPQNALSLYIQTTGTDFTRDEDTCFTYLQNRAPNIQPTEEQVSSALSYTTISVSTVYDTSILVASLRRIVPPTFSWSDVVQYFDQRDVRVSSQQFLQLYRALLPIAKHVEQNDQAPKFNIESLWGGSHWENAETQLSFICAYASLGPDELDASKIPGLQPTLTLEEYAQSPPEIQERAAFVIRHPLVSGPALTAIFQVALHSLHASQSTEAKRLFQEVVVPNLDIFIVSAFGVPKPWPQMAVETLNSLFESFLYRRSTHYDFVLESLWRKDKDWVAGKLHEVHHIRPLDLPLILDHVVTHGWLEELIRLPSGFSYDLAALAHAEGALDLKHWAHVNRDRGTEFANSLLRFLIIKSNEEFNYQRPPDGEAPQRASTTLQVKSVAAMLQILEDSMPINPPSELIAAQRTCITAYPRLINYGEGFDDIIDANSRHGNALPPDAVAKMEEHYKRMYSSQTEVKQIVQKLEEYKRSPNPLEQDIFACMIHGLFDEYSHFADYPLEALATTAVLFGGVISHKLISELPLKIGLGMILEAVRDQNPDHPMYKFGLQALMQLLSRFREWPGFCTQLLQIPGLHGTEAFKRAQDVAHESEEEASLAQSAHGAVDAAAGEALLNGPAADGPEVHVPPFTAINVDPPPPGVVFEDPQVEVKDRIQFGLNNLTVSSLQSTFNDICEIMEDRHQQWFASHLVEERAKMQPNYHEVYLDLVKLFEHQGLWSEVLRQTYATVGRMLNSETTAQNSSERTNLKYLGAWLGLLTIARDKPIKHRSMAFKQLLVEAHDTKRSIVVIPFVCKVLVQAAKSTIFRPPNPWLMDIIRLLIELYHNGELKLNQKFEIEVLCKELSLDHKSIDPSRELEDRLPLEDVNQLAMQETLEPFDNLSLNGMAGGVSTGLSPHADPVNVPDLGPHLVIPPTNEMVVNPQRLHEIVRTALTRALQDIIQPVVDRSVTIAAISTQQMIHKDFATEPDENKLRTAAINMVKATAGSLALVTSKEPLRANITNGLRSLSSELPSGLPEGTIIMCVNSNLDLACKVIESSAEDRAVPEIEDMIESELENRRRHRQTRPNEAYVDPALSRWAMTIPHPFKLSPTMAGLNTDQMAIYDDFARQPRGATQSSATHAASTSDAARTIPNEILQDQYSAVPNLPTPAETPSLPHLNTQMPYSHVHGAMTNGRGSGPATQTDSKFLMEKVQTLLTQLERVANDASEEHFGELPRPHDVLDAVDTFTQTIIKQNSEEFALFAAEKIIGLLFRPEGNRSLFLESLAHILELLLKISASFGTTVHDRVQSVIFAQPPRSVLNLSLIAVLLPIEMIDLHNVDHMLSKELESRREGSLTFLDELLTLAVLGDRPVALFADFIRSLDVSWKWMAEDPSLEAGQQLKSKLARFGYPQPANQLAAPDGSGDQHEQFDYMFDEWIRLYSNFNSSERDLVAFTRQFCGTHGIASKDDFFVFARAAMDLAVNHYDHYPPHLVTNSDIFMPVDALVKLICVFAKESTARLDDAGARLLSTMNSAIALVAAVLNHHHAKRGESFSQRVFFRMFSLIFHAVDSVFADIDNSFRDDFTLQLTDTLLLLAPQQIPGFSFAWMQLISHRRILPELVMLDHRRGWKPLGRLLETLLQYTSEIMKPADTSEASKDYYRAVIKLFIIIQHDFPDYMTTNCLELCSCVPPYMKQIRNVILSSSPRDGVTDPGVDHDALVSSSSRLSDSGMLEVLERLVEHGPSEDAVAHLTHAITRGDVDQTTFAYAPVTTNTELIKDVVNYVSGHALSRFERDGSLFDPNSPDFRTISFLTHELQPEARYFFLVAIIDRLRYPGPVTEYFILTVFELFGNDFNDPEEAEIRQQIVRIFLERVIGYWPQPPGVLRAVAELLREDKYRFFDQPFIKADREIADHFTALKHGVP